MGRLHPIGRLRRAGKDIDDLRQQGTRWATVAALSLSAALSRALGLRSRAEAQALQAQRGMEELGMRVFAACMKKRRGELLGGAAGAALASEADDELRRAGVTAPEPMTDMLMPPLGGW